MTIPARGRDGGNGHGEVGVSPSTGYAAEKPERYGVRGPISPLVGLGFPAGRA